MDVLYIFLWLVFSVLVALFANSQNRSGLGWFFAALLISPLISFIILLAVGKIETSSPSQTNSQPTSDNKTSSPHKPDSNISETKDCPFCAETIKKAAIVCRYCGHNLVESKPSAKTENLAPEVKSGSPEQKLLEGVLANNWGKVNSAIMLGADLSVKMGGMSITELAEQHSNNSVQSLIEKHSAKIRELPLANEETQSVQIPLELKNTNEGKLIEGILTSNWGKVNSALMLGADIAVIYEGKTTLEMARENNDASIISLIERQYPT